jgi:hypothetical protein
MAWMMGMAQKWRVSGVSGIHAISDVKVKLSNVRKINNLTYPYLTQIRKRLS